MSVNEKLDRILEKPHGELEVGELIYGMKTFKANRGAEGYREEDELKHLRATVSAAVTLEFATLPPYLAAIWSIKNDVHPVAKSLRVILQEEMLHMSLACNLLVAIGGKPRISAGAPLYPGKLPLNVHPELIVHIEGLGKSALTTFMEIERPNHPGHHVALAAAQDIASEDPHPEGDFTIGMMYEEMLASFQRLKPKLTVDHQLTGPLAWQVVTDLAGVEKAIHTITRQGEGSEGPADTGPDDLAHYYRFAEMMELKSLVYDAKKDRYAFETPIELDYERDVYPVAKVPAGGYTEAATHSPEVRRLVRGFNLVYSKLLDLLQDAWEKQGGQAMFWRAIETMFELQKYAIPLMQIPRPDGTGNYCPDFRYISKSER